MNVQPKRSSNGASNTNHDSASVTARVVALVAEKGVPESTLQLFEKQNGPIGKLWESVKGADASGKLAKEDPTQPLTPEEFAAKVAQGIEDMHKLLKSALG